MDFRKDLLDDRGYGEYERLPTKDLPAIWLSYLADPSDSGRIHSNIRQKFDAGDANVHDAMKKFAQYAEDAKKAILESKWEEFVSLMNANFDLRKDIYSEECIGKMNMEMIKLGRQYGSSTKFPGSGGAVIGICFDGEKLSALKLAMQSHGFVICDVVPNLPKHE